MPAFEYTALDVDGREHKGVLEGDSPRAVRQQLRERQWTPLNVQEVAAREAKSARRFSLVRGVAAADLALMTRQLATLVRSGLPLEESVRAVSQQTEKARLKSMLLGVRSRVMEGHSLAAGFAEFPHVFPELYRATVAAGEQSGHLDVVLERLADYTESRQQLRQKIQLALFYPALLTILAISVVALLLTYVVPQVVQVFQNIGQQLPLLTRGLIALSDFMRAYGPALLVLLVFAVAGSSWLLRKPGPRRQWHAFLLRLPLVSRLTRGLNTARFARTFSILLASGVPALEALRISAEVIGNLPMREAVEEAARKVREGSSIFSALEKSRYFPPLTLHLIASGEMSGKLEDMLERAAISQEREIEVMVATLLGLFEPLLIVVMGGLVLIIVLAILLPIFDLNQLVK
ncbi:MAG: type II secretion system inner membrane protein GspF [Gammaproteobacteria bacterium]|nr:type II secretion system inner membrane protein GspF [Gammaproteobacteria bacterium]